MRTITFTGTVVDSSGNPARGWMTTAALEAALVPEADTVIAPQPVEVELDTDGSWSVPLVLPTELGELTPVLAEVHLLLADTRPQTVVLNVQTSDDTVDYADAPRVMLFPSDRAGSPVVTWSVVGQPGGVAPLNDVARVPEQYLPPGAGGSAGRLDDLNDVDGAYTAESGTILRKGDDGIWRPSPANQSRGDVVFFRSVAPPDGVVGYEVNDVWIDYGDSFAVYQREAS